MWTRRSGLGWVLVLALSLGIAGMATPGYAQERGEIPEISNAELMFEQGLAAYERGEYETAYERFRLVNEFELNRKTTAAFLMGAKALVQLRRYREAIDRLEILLDRYPDTTYRQEARGLIERSENRLQDGMQARDTLRIGVTLPMSGARASLSQALFNGIRLAVEEHNGLRRRFIRPPGLQPSADTFGVYDTEEGHRDSLSEAEGATTVAASTDTARVDSMRVVTEQVGDPDWVAKMYFRQIGDRPESAGAAVDSLVRRDRVDVILGPIGSAAARPAAQRAEEAEVLLVAPVATDESVSKGRDHVFQANPTILTRGRVMARFTKNGILLDRAGIIYEPGNSYSKRMAEGFQEAARRHDLEVPLTIPLQNSRDWSRLPALIEEDSTLIETDSIRARRDPATTDSLMAVPEAYYLPVSGRGTTGKIQGALTGMREVFPRKRALGNAEWHNLPFSDAASSVTATYTNGFFVQTDRPAVQRFVQRYRMLTGTTPDELSTDGRRLAYAGYDVARFLISVLSPSPSRPDPRTLRTAPTYDGLGMRIGFEGKNGNQTLFIHRYRNEQIERLR
jgi:ABC-type branched-subunit amino acid transport system substrate-binding protein